MATKQIIATDKAPKAIGAYSQAVRSGNTVYISGQIPLDPTTQLIVNGDARAHIHRVFQNIQAITEAAGGGLDDIVKLTVYLIYMGDFPIVNEVMSEYFSDPYPARAAIGVASLPKGVGIEMDAIMVL